MAYTDVRPATSQDYMRALLAPSSVPIHTGIAPPQGERAVAVSNQVTTGSGLSPAAIGTLANRRGITPAATSRPNYGGGVGMGQRRGVGGMLTHPAVLLGAAALIGYFVFVRRS